MAREKLKRFVVTYTDSPGSLERFTWETKAYDAGHALDKFNESDEGYEVLSVARKTDHRGRVVD